MSENEQPSSNAKQTNVGQKLRAAREAKGYTLDDLQQITKIQKRYLIAIEDDKFDQLPGDFYVRAFVKQYANTVGLDGDDLLKQYDDELPQTKTHEYSEHISQAVETRTSHHKAAEQMEAARRKYLPTIIIAVIVVLILGVIWIMAIVRHQENSTKIDRSSVSVSGESSKKEKQSSSSSKKTVKKTTSAVKLTEASRNSTSVTYNAKSLKKSTQLVLTTTGQSANSVAVDNTTRLNKTMNANGKETVVLAKNANTVVIRIGTTANTKLKLGGKTIDFTSNNRYPQTRTVTIHFGNTSSSSSSSSTSSSARRTTTNSGSTTTSATTNSNSGQRTTTNTGTTNTRTTTTTNSNQSSTTNTQNRQQTTTNNGGNSTAASNR
ncbi:helix-turn-helix domain-containing protein [Limosilactobacillus sp.]|uniref:helix-turn-helix domain-containing protein n=1 Tax=Limosilactobacillus sp. TaxID=2773925 RepID=UPI00345EF2C4